MHMRLTVSGVLKVFYRKECRSQKYMKVAYCSWINKSQKPSNKENMFLFY